MLGKVIFIFLHIFVVVISKRLVQVVILSRHNIRAPLTANLRRFSPNPWPIWLDKPGSLTAKGALLEEYMGEYLSDWIKKENLLGEDCPLEEDIHIYANTKHRTRESAKAFVRGAFINCNINVHVIDSDEMDPVFNPIIHNASKELKAEIVKEMQNQLDNLQLRDAYLELENILDFQNSHTCINEKICSFANVKDRIFYKIGEEPNLIGPLAYGNSIIDSFIMGYYEGMPLEKVAWGKIKTSKQWTTLAKITKENQNVRFNSTKLAKEVARPLIDYLTTLFIEDKPPKFSLLHGHDANLNSVMAAIGFEGFVLPDQYEITPLGGKLIWQKWHDDKLDRDFLKVNYVYQSVHQLRDGTKLSQENPPKWVQLNIQACPTDEDGYCLWSDFIKILNLI